jgi:hypothetical protein
LIHAIGGAVHGAIYAGYMQEQFQMMRHYYGGEPSSDIAYLAIPTVNFFSALLLWFYSPPLSAKVFANMESAEVRGTAGELPRTLARLLAIYLIIGGITGLVEFMTNKAIELGWLSGNYYSNSANWEDLTTSLVWLIAGLVLHIGAGRVLGGMKGVGNAIADDLWRIKPEDDEPKTQA